MIRHPLSDDGPQDEDGRDLWAAALDQAVLGQKARIAKMSEVTDVTITETVIYSHGYTRYELTAFLVKKGWTEASLEPLTGPELAELITTERPGQLEEALQHHSDVQGSTWTATIRTQETS